MQTQEIGFSELRNAYTQVREFVKEQKGCEDKEIGLYSTIEEDLGIEELDYHNFENQFIARFNIAIIENNKTKIQNTIWENLRNILIVIIYTPFVPFLIVFAIILLVISKVFPKFFPEVEIQLPSKKAWQQGKLTVADLVSTLIAKEYLPKKDVKYVLKNKE